MNGKTLEQPAGQQLFRVLLFATYHSSVSSPSRHNP